MDLLSLLFEGIIGVLLLVFIIATMIGLLYHMHTNPKPSETSSTTDDVTSKETGINVPQDKQVETEEIIDYEQEFSVVKNSDLTIHTMVPSDINIITSNDTIENEEQNSSESQACLDNNIKLKVSKQSNRKAKKRRA